MQNKFKVFKKNLTLSLSPLNCPSSLITVKKTLGFAIVVKVLREFRIVLLKNVEARKKHTPTITAEKFKKKKSIFL
jgi:hypothetical protein